MSMSSCDETMCMRHCKQARAMHDRDGTNGCTNGWKQEQDVQQAQVV
jgi:hypothetical protein